LFDFNHFPNKGHQGKIEQSGDMGCNSGSGHFMAPIQLEIGYKEGFRKELIPKTKTQLKKGGGSERNSLGRTPRSRKQCIPLLFFHKQDRELDLQ
jgi:hypothetical protein